MTKGMRNLWEDKYGHLACLLLAFIISSKPMILWVIVATFMSLVLGYDRLRAMLLAIPLNFALLTWFGEYFR